MRILKFFPIIILTFMANVSSAQGLGPDTGEMLPHNLSMMATSGKVENHDSLTGDKGTAIFFVPSFDWCPYCQK